MTLPLQLPVLEVEGRPPKETAGFRASSVANGGTVTPPGLVDYGPKLYLPFHASLDGPSTAIGVEGATGAEGNELRNRLIGAWVDLRPYRRARVQVNTFAASGGGAGGGAVGGLLSLAWWESAEDMMTSGIFSPAGQSGLIANVALNALGGLKGAWTPIPAAARAFPEVYVSMVCNSIDPQPMGNLLAVFDPAPPTIVVVPPPSADPYVVVIDSPTFPYTMGVDDTYVVTAHVEQGGAVVDTTGWDYFFSDYSPNIRPVAGADPLMLAWNSPGASFVKVAASNPTDFVESDTLAVTVTA